MGGAAGVAAGVVVAVFRVKPVVAGLVEGAEGSAGLKEKPPVDGAAGAPKGVAGVAVEGVAVPKVGAAGVTGTLGAICAAGVTGTWAEVVVVVEPKESGAAGVAGT